jgi:predicted amidohydrolase
MSTKRFLKIALLQLKGSSNKTENLLRAKSKILEASSNGAELIVLPECFQSPYAIESFAEYAEDISSKSESSVSYKMLSESAKEAQVYLIGGSIPERDSKTDKLFNTCVVFNPHGQEIAIHRKVHLFDIDVPGKIKFKESAVLSPGCSLTHFEVKEWGKIGLGICYDLRFPEIALLAARKHGVTAMIYPGAFNMTTGPLHWELLLRSRAVDNQIYIGGCAPARNTDASYVAWGHSTLVDPMGQVIGTTDETEGIVYGLLDNELINETRSSIPTSNQRRFDLYPDITRL